MAERGWLIGDLPWERFEPAAVDADLLALVKAASLVEANARDYAAYLCKVFADDDGFCAAAAEWAEEETQHGAALGRWAETADPRWRHDVALARFRIGYAPPLEGAVSTRGSRTGEMVARCIVETGTSSYYTAMADASREPVLTVLCRRIAADELRHYKMFYTYVRKYAPIEEASRPQRLKVAVGRWLEAEDDELAYAFYAANAPAAASYVHHTYNNAYARLAYSIYRRRHIDRMLAMLFKTCGLTPYSLFNRWSADLAWALLQRRVRRAAGSYTNGPN